jgi:methylated-DNA-[protein]-cysteine S-methyltransferase
MRYSSRVAQFSTRTGNCALRVTAGPDGIDSIDLNPTGPPPGPCEESQPLLRTALDQLAAYFAGRLFAFDLPLAAAGTEFQKSVWQALVQVPYGATASYAEIARRIGRPKAVRAVGAANGRNPIPIVVPCHRIIGSTGRLVGYGGGLAMKKMLLELEAEHAERLRSAAAR